MYNFVDTTTGPTGGKALPAEAMKYNGVYLEDEIPGYQTLYVSGRELMESEVQEKEITGIDGLYITARPIHLVPLPSAIS